MDDEFAERLMRLVSPSTAQHLSQPHHVAQLPDTLARRSVVVGARSRPVTSGTSRADSAGDRVRANDQGNALARVQNDEEHRDDVVEWVSGALTYQCSPSCSIPSALYCSRRVLVRVAGGP